MSPNSIFNQNSNDSNQIGMGGQMMNSSIDLGPICTSWLVNFIRNKLEQLSASQLIHIIKTKEKRKVLNYL